MADMSERIQSIADVKPFQKPQDSIFAKTINRRISRVITFFLVKNFRNITPPQVTWMSTVTSVVGCALFLHPNYWWRLVGIVLLQLGFTLDCCDGEVARLKNNGSKYGMWLDSVSDRVKEFTMLGALTMYWYWYKQPEAWVLIVGFCGIIGLLIVSYFREAKKSVWPTTREAEVFITKNIYIGTVDVTIYLVCFAVLVNYEIGALWIFLAVSIPMLVKQMLSAYKKAD